MRPFQQYTHFLGFDWASDHHDVCLLDRDGKILVQLRFEDTAEGWRHMRSRMPAGACIAVAVETSAGSFVDRLLDSNFAVYPVHPLQSQRYRQRIAPSGASDDQRAAWALADALRLDGQHWRPLAEEHPLTLELRHLCRDQVALIEQRTAFVCQLKAALHEYFPAALDAFDDWTHQTAWDFILTFPTPDALHKAGKRRQQAFLMTHRLGRPKMLAHRLAIFAHAPEFQGKPHVVSAKALLACSYAKCLRTLEVQIKRYDERIQALYAQHPDRDWFGSLPIPKDGRTAPRLLAELGDDRSRFDSAQGLQCFAGTAPLTRRSGIVIQHKFRRGCNHHLRYAMHWFADLSRKHCSWAKTYYHAKREEQKSHQAAVRCLGQRWLKIIFRLWQDRKPYDPHLHLENQLRHGSWLLTLKTPDPAPAAPTPTPAGAP